MTSTPRHVWTLHGAGATPAVSIILPTFNRASFLPRAFASIADQRFRDWELIVIDDGSTDDTAPVVEQLSREIDRPVAYPVPDERRRVSGAQYRPRARTRRERRVL